jgi:glycosyltransferase involved in cell wall biosynthesis
MRITYFILGEEYGGGMSQQALELIRYFNERGHEVSIICPPNYHYLGKMKELGVKTYVNKWLKTRRRKLELLDLAGFYQSYVILKKIKPDILHAHCIKAGFMVAILGKLLGIKNVLYTNHGWPFSEMKAGPKLILKNIQKFISRMVRMIICVSRADRDLAVKEKLCPPDRICYIHNGIELPPMPLAPKDDKYFNVIFVARLVRSKDPYTLIKAVSRLKESNIRLFILGSGEEEGEVVEYVSQLNLKDRVIMKGEMPHDHVLQSLARSHLFVLTTNREGFGLAVLEAMALGLPVIATRIGGLPELVQDGVNGFLVAPKDDVGLSQKIKYFMDNRQMLVKMGLNGRRIAEDKFKLSDMLKKYDRLYSSLAG